MCRFQLGASLCRRRADSPTVTWFWGAGSALLVLNFSLSRYKNISLWKKNSYLKLLSEKFASNLRIFLFSPSINIKISFLLSRYRSLQMDWQGSCWEASSFCKSIKRSNKAVWVCWTETPVLCCFRGNGKLGKQWMELCAARAGALWAQSESAVRGALGDTRGQACPVHVGSVFPSRPHEEIRSVTILRKS